MSGWMIVGIVALAVVNLPINAGVLWLACRLLRVGEARKGIDYARAFRLTLVIFGVGWGLLCVILPVARLLCALPPGTLAFRLLLPLGIVVPLAILKWSLRARWPRTILVWAVWRLLTLAQSAPVYLLLKPYLPEGF